MGNVNIAIHAVIEDYLEDDLYQRRITKSIADGGTSIEVAVPGDLVPPIVIASEHAAVTRHELRLYNAIRNQQSRMNDLPEARRRKEERKERRREHVQARARQGDRCPGCGGTGWVQDDEGNSKPCPACRG